MDYAGIVELLKTEVVPALGCTEPIAVALAAAHAAKVLKDTPEEVEVLVSGNILKNGMGVGIPGTGMTGIDIAAVLGAMGSSPEKGLQVLKNVNDQHLKTAKVYLKNKKVTVKMKEVPEKLYIEVICRCGSNESRAIIAERHDNVILIELNGEKLFEKGLNEESGIHESEPQVELTIDTIYEFATTVETPEIEFLLEGVDMNKKVSDEGLKKDYGLGVGKSIMHRLNGGTYTDDVVSYAMALTASAADARMAGCEYPVMSSAGSGNHGITAILPVVAIADRLNCDAEKLVRALAISHLLNIYIKRYTGRLSAICGCGAAASTGASAAIVYLMDGKLQNINYAVKNMLGNISGIICDGAKPGCALKLSTAVNAAFQSAMLAINNVVISDKDGIVCASADETIRNLGKISEQGMMITDQVILEIMKRK